MQNFLRVVGIQADLVWERVEENLQNFERIIDSLSDGVDLVVLPEMFATGFTMNPQPVAETMSGISVRWMKKTAAKKQAALIGSLVIKEDDLYYNRVVFAHPEGRVETYDKRHAFTLSGEDKAYTTGTSKVIINYKGWKICPLICYDLRFPVWSRNVEKYDLLLYMANWPKPRILAWDTLLQARAIENMSYCVGVNRVGADQNGYEFSGHSTAYDYLGHQLSNSVEHMECTFEVVLDKNAMLKTRKKLNFLNDKDTFEIKD